MKNSTCLSGLLLAGSLFAGSLSAQEVGEDLFEMSLEELMNVSIVSASQQEERLFDAPLASFVISREDMRKAGVSSIPEALRLSPEVIVRETTNGNYEISLRGFDNPVHYTSTASQTNTLTLVMVDNRPVFNYNMGGTFWETLPVDLVDVERIEIVRGPAAPLFGPNAVTGVINIITRSAALKGSFISLNLHQQPDFEGTAASLRLGEQLNDKLALGLSGTYQRKNRLDDVNYLYFPVGLPPQFVPSAGYHAQDIATVNPELALDKKAANIWLDFTPSEKQNWRLSAGLSDSENQRVFFSSSSPLTFGTNQSKYANLNGQLGEAGVRLSYTSGKDELQLESGGYTTAYEYKVLDADVNYRISVGEKFNLRPQLSYQHSEYSDEAYSTLARRGLMGGATHAMNLLAGSLKGEYFPIDALRLIASGRFDKFDVSDKAYLSYQFAGTYTLNEQIMFRASHAKSYSGIFYNYRYIDAVIPSFVTFPSGKLEEGLYVIQGNNSEVLTNNTATELGIRFQPKASLQFDLGYFTQRLKNPIAFTFTGQTGAFPVSATASFPYEQYKYQALPMEGVQQGLTLSATYVPNSMLQIRPFITWQRTEMENFDFHNFANLPLYQGTTVAHESTPEWYGGAFLNFAPIEKLNVNISSYFFSKTTQYHMQDITILESPFGAQGEARMAAKTLLNMNVAYNVWDKLRLSVGVKNLLDNDSREYYGADRNGRLLFTTINYNF